MSFFTTDHSQVKNTFEPVKPGEYEVVITETEVKTSQNGNPMIRTVYTIRSDVDQPFQNRKLFDNLVQSENAMFRFQQVAKAIGLPNGFSVSTIEEFAKLMLYKAVRVKVTNKNEVYNGETRVRENIVFISEPTVPYGGETANDPFANVGDDFPEMPDEENNISSVPPWEVSEPKPQPSNKKKGKSKSADPFADDGKPLDISEDDIPF